MTSALRGMPVSEDRGHLVCSGREHGRNVSPSRCDLPCHGWFVDWLCGRMARAVAERPALEELAIGTSTNPRSLKERKMTRTDGSLARRLDFEGSPPSGVPSPEPARMALRLARPSRLAGPGKYKVLDARRRHAQIRARRLLDLLDAQENGR